MEEFGKAQAEIVKKNEKLMSQKMSRQFNYRSKMMLWLYGWGVIFVEK